MYVMIIHCCTYVQCNDHCYLTKSKTRVCTASIVTCVSLSMWDRGPQPFINLTRKLYYVKCVTTRLSYRGLTWLNSPAAKSERPIFRIARKKEREKKISIFFLGRGSSREARKFSPQISDDTAHPAPRINICLTRIFFFRFKNRKSLFCDSNLSCKIDNFYF